MISNIDTTIDTGMFSRTLHYRTMVTYCFFWVCDLGNANKKLLLELNCLPRLLKLILSENRTIRRDATLVLGSMSRYCEYDHLSSSLYLLFHIILAVPDCRNPPRVANVPGSFSTFSLHLTSRKPV